MAQNLFDLGPLPRSNYQRRNLFDPSELAQSMAAPQAAREAGKVQVAQALANIPNQIMQGLQTGQSLRMNQIQIDQLKREGMPVEQVAPNLVSALKSKNIDLTGATFGEAKQIVPLLSNLSKEDQDRGFIWDPVKKDLTPVTSDKGTISTKQAEVLRKENAPQRPKNLTTAETNAVLSLESSGVRLAGLKNQVETDPEISQLLGPLSPEARSNLVRQLANDAKFAKFASGALKEFNQYRKQITGAAASFPEIKLLEPTYPQLTDPPDVFVSKAVQALDDIDTNRGILKQLFESQGKVYPSFKGLGGPSKSGVVSNNSGPKLTPNARKVSP